MRPVSKRFWTAFPVVLVVMFAATLPLCGLMFQCGCTLLTGERDCNMHERGVPHCPWCTGGLAVQAGHFGAMIWAAVLGTIFGARRGGLWRAMIYGAIAFLCIAVLGGLLVCWATGYPIWFGVRVGA